MCFSATVSFGASAIIGATGLLAWKEAQNLPQKILASTPLLFAIQQFSEGLIWLSLMNPDHNLSQLWYSPLVYFFIILAWLVWPIFIPFFLYKLEITKIKKDIFKGFIVWGIVIAIILIYILATNEINATIIDHHIVYYRETTNPYELILGICYCIPLTIPLFFSTIRKLQLLGTLNLFSLLITKFYFENYLISVWCFFAAISSFLILWIIIELNGYKSRGITHFFKTWHSQKTSNE